MTEFSTEVVERIGWYVYLLRDPRTRTVFYVGKGRGNRAFQHAKDADALPDEDKPKLATIRQIRAEQFDVQVEVIRHALSSEKAAYEVEAAVLDALRAVGVQLTNLAGGHHSAERGWATADVVASIYDAPPARDIVEPVALFRLPKLWHPTMTPEEVYEAVHGWWRLKRHVGPRARYAFAVSNGVVRGVYVIEYWRERLEGDRGWQDDHGKESRLGFFGKPAPELQNLIGTSVKDYFPRGFQGERYLNCSDATLPRRPVHRGSEAQTARRAETSS